MEKQRSCSFKRTKFLVFSFIFLFVVLFFFSVWGLKARSSFNLAGQFQLNQPSFNSGLKTPRTLSSFGGNVSDNDSKNGILFRTPFTRPITAFDIAKIFKGIKEKESEDWLTDEESNKVDIVNGNYWGPVNNSQIAVNYGISTDTHFIGPENSSGTHKHSAFKESHDRSEPESGMDSSKIIIGNSLNVQYQSNYSSYEKDEGSGSDIIDRAGERVCDVMKGKWVFDKSYPLYTTASCPFVDEGFSCEANGRPDKRYMKWRWQPQDCNIPRFNASKMLELMRGKRLVFVGDSINRNQWESMLCLLLEAVKDPKKVYETHGRRIAKDKGNYSFKFVVILHDTFCHYFVLFLQTCSLTICTFRPQDYQCTVEYYVTHFLVHESKARIGKKRTQTLRIDAIEKGSSRWKGADILIFNTAHWWTHYKTKSGINFYQEGDQVYPHLDVTLAFRKALLTWASWVDKHINPRKTHVFFRSSSPSHFREGQWNSGGHCGEASLPLIQTSALYNQDMNVIVQEVIRQMRTPVTVLNITNLSDYRIDGHPSIYRLRNGKIRSSEVQDCSHWCLPGVPDTWNELLFYRLQSESFMG